MTCGGKNNNTLATLFIYIEGYVLTGPGLEWADVMDHGHIANK
jgi:hypothetical protein